jgi:small-conductance mechanosensitive channel
VDEELLYTGKIVSFPNNQIFSGGISNFTKRDLLFWHHFSIILQINNENLRDISGKLTTIINNVYNTLLKDELYEESQARKSIPKVRLEITEQGIKVHVRVLVHFYRVAETNNALMIALTNAHQDGKITLLKHKDYDWIQTK